MNSIPIFTDRILAKLDAFFAKNDYIGAENHLKYWLNEAEACQDKRSELLLCNELIGLSRKTSQREQALKYGAMALDILRELDIENSVSAATTYINVATAYKAFDCADISLPFFYKAMDIYERELPSADSRLGGLYNNMALSLVDLSKFEDSRGYYQKALTVMNSAERGELEQAITQLNIASSYEAELGLLDGEGHILSCLDKAQALLDIYSNADDGYYAFVCEKCATVFAYYGYFMYANELKERTRKIYERN